MIYLDHAATTPVDPQVREAMLPFLSDRFGNPSSIHAIGRDARAAMDSARESIAAALSADFSEVYFTSSGTEADNLAIIGTMLAAPPERRRDRLLNRTSCRSWQRQVRGVAGFRVTCLPVDSEGWSTRQRLRARSPTTRRSSRSCTATTRSNDSGCCPAREDRTFRRRALPYGCCPDVRIAADQRPRNRLRPSFNLIAQDLRSQGCGRAVRAVRDKSLAIPLRRSAGAREAGRTENVPAIVGFGKAAEIAEHCAKRNRPPHRLRNDFIDRLLKDSRRALNGPSRRRRLPNNVNISIEGVDGAAVLMNLDRAGIAASSGSACSSGSIGTQPRPDGNRHPERPRRQRNPIYPRSLHHAGRAGRCCKHAFGHLGPSPDTQLTPGAAGCSGNVRGVKMIQHHRHPIRRFARTDSASASAGSLSVYSRLSARSSLPFRSGYGLIRLPEVARDPLR